MLRAEFQCLRPTAARRGDCPVETCGRWLGWGRQGPEGEVTASGMPTDAGAGASAVRP